MPWCCFQCFLFQCFFPFKIGLEDKSHRASQLYSLRVWYAWNPSAYIFFPLLTDPNPSPYLIVNKSNYFNISCITRMGSSSRFGLFVFYEKLKLKFLTVTLRYYVAVCLVLVFNIENSYVFLISSYTSV